MPDTPAYPGTDRDAFLARIRGALGRDAPAAPAEPAPDVDEALARLAGEGDDLLALFRKGAEATGLKVYPASRDDAAARVVDLLQQAEAKRIASGAGETGQQIGLARALEQAGIEAADEQTPMSEQYDLDAGVSDVRAALAETGTLVCTSDARRSRGPSLVPVVHVALVRESDVLPDMIDYWNSRKGESPAELPSSQVFITGPSKTADIEGQLVTGVHGPGEVHVVLIAGI
ncbi:MAG: LutC/YkgG family protein [Phycisphaeraceae bacterium]